MKTLVCDVETNALHNYTKLWCVVTYCLETKELKVFDYKADGSHIDDFRKYSHDATAWVGHNFINFDRHVLQYFIGGGTIPVNQITDTLVLSRLFNSGRDGGHSLERWGSYFNVPKVGGDYEDWENYDPIIMQRCIRDVGITLKLYNFQQKEGKHVSNTAIQLEQRFAELTKRITDRGFPIDKELLDQKYTAMDARKQSLEQKIREAFPPRPVKIAEVHPKRTKTGDFAKNTKGFTTLGKESSLVAGPFSLIEWQEFNIGSPKQVVERMNEYDWKPVEFTKSGKNPKVSEANLNTLPPSAPDEAQYIVEFLKLKTRLQLMDNWYENLTPDTHKLHGSIIHIGAITQRCAHRNPNTANIPGNDEWNIRECWAVPRGGDYRLVGVDAKGIQLRILGHLTDDEEFKHQVVHGDPHMFNVKMIGPELLPQSTEEEQKEARKKAKTFIYAWLLGAGFQKVGTIFGVDASKGKSISQKYLSNFQSLARLKQYLSRCAEKGWYPCPDGRFIPIKSDHYSLSVALQGLESIIMKLAGLLWQDWVDQKKLDAHLIAFVHDEYVIEAHKDVAQEAGDLMAKAIAKAGEMLNLRVPMEGDDPKINFNWAEIH